MLLTFQWQTIAIDTSINVSLRDWYWDIYEWKVTSDALKNRTKLSSVLTRVLLLWLVRFLMHQTLHKFSQAKHRYTFLFINRWPNAKCELTIFLFIFIYSCNLKRERQSGLKLQVLKKVYVPQNWSIRIWSLYGPWAITD